LPRTENEKVFTLSSLAGLAWEITYAIPWPASQSFDKQPGCLISEEMAYFFRVSDIICSLAVNWDFRVPVYFIHLGDLVVITNPIRSNYNPDTKKAL
jgi:hypothetical protein